MITLKKEDIAKIDGIVYFVDGNKKIFAMMNSHRGDFSYFNELDSDVQGFFEDLARDTKDDKGVTIYNVPRILVKEVNEHLEKKYKRVTHYDWIV